MNELFKYLLLISSLIVLGLIFHPEKVIYEPRIVGNVVDERGVPLNNAVVKRVGDDGVQYTKTDKQGSFILEELSMIDWIHLPFDLPFAWCCTGFEVSKNGYESYKAKFDDYCNYNESFDGCKNIIFTPVITLKSY